MRGLFKGSNNQIQYGYDFSSLENRVQGYYVYKYEGGPELAEALLAERPNDIHKLPYYTEYLTTEGWKTIDEITYDTLVAQYDPETKGITFVKPLNIIHSDKEETMYTFSSSKFSMEVSDKHRVLLVDEDDNVHTKLAKDISLLDDLYIPRSGYLENPSEDTPEYLTRYSKTSLSEMSLQVETKHIRCGCLQVPSTYLMVKQHDNIFITGNCFSQDTEILTDNGWKTFDSLKKEDKVLQYDPKLDVSSFVIPDEIVWERYKGKMIQFEGKTTDILVTPNHRVLHKEEEYQTSLASELTEFTYPSTSRVENGSDELPTAFYELLLILRSYGTSEYLMTPRQPLVRRVKKLLDKLERTYTTQKRGTRTVIRFDVPEIAEQWDKNLATLSLNTRVELIKSMKKWAGDYVSNKFLYLENNSEEFMDSIQELCSISGFTTTVEEKEIGGYTTQSLVINYYSRGFKKAVSKKEVDYDGYVGCVSVPTGYITVRRNRKTCISGNTINARKLGIDRTDAKSLTYALLYGASPPKLKKMLNLDDKGAEKMYNDFWDSVPPLKELRDNVTKFWKGTGNAYILGIDKRKFRVRSQHSLLNLLFQSCGSLAVKYTTMLVAQYLEEMGILGDLTRDTKGESEQKVNQCIVYHRNRKYEK